MLISHLLVSYQALLVNTDCEQLMIDGGSDQMVNDNNNLCQSSTMADALMKDKSG